MATAAFEFVLGNLLYHFDWKLPDGMETEDLSMEEELGLAVHKKIPLCLVPIKLCLMHHASCCAQDLIIITSLIILKIIVEFY
ncbi:hypothetical protein QYF36_001368 [Acer negundo]|nr:hypothetical protein QYF36_001368 [Acer negundo]